MVDALEAERNAANRSTTNESALFTCEPAIEEAEPSPAPRPQRSTDEPAS
jgi:hypothetical protein